MSWCLEKVTTIKHIFILKVLAILFNYFSRSGKAGKTGARVSSRRLVLW